MLRGKAFFKLNVLFTANSVHCRYFHLKNKERLIFSQIVQLQYFRPPQSSVYHEKCSAALIKEFGAITEWFFHPCPLKSVSRWANVIRKSIRNSINSPQKVASARLVPLLTLFSLLILLLLMLNLSQEILRGKQSGWVLYFLLGKVTYWLTLGSFSEVQVKNQPINSVLVLDDIF